jgi:hypothetical protein
VNLDTVGTSDATIRFIVTARIADLAASSQNSMVNCTFVDGTGITTLASGQLADNGVSPDLRNGDSVFTAQVTISAQDLLVGKYVCQIVAQNANGFTSNTFLLPIVIGRELNHPPALSDLQAPDTISRSGQAEQLLTVKATDSDGRTDIAKVFFKSFKPDGTATNGGNAILMYDDGSESIIFAPDITSGDAIKGDGIYTFPLRIDTSAAIGRYRFVFQATDRSNASSDTLIRYIYVKQ